MVKVQLPKTRLEKLREAYRDSLNQKANSILLIDGMNLFLASFNASYMNNAEGENVGGIYSALRTLMSLINKFSPNQVIMCFDGERGSEFRRKLYSNYKQERAGLKNSKKIGRLDRQKEAATQLKKFWLYIDNLPIRILIANGMEADDAIAYMATNKFENYKKIIVSNDKDFYQLVNNDVTVYSNTKKKMFTKQKILDEFEILPENFPIYRAIDGDKSDNIDGIKGIGIKTINKLFPELGKKKITLEDIFIICDSKQGVNNKYAKILEERHKIIRNYKLMQLQNSYLEAKDKLYIREKLDEEMSVYNFPMIKSFLLQDGFMSEIRRKVFWDSCFKMLNANAIRHNKKRREELNEQRGNT